MKKLLYCASIIAALSSCGKKDSAPVTLAGTSWTVQYGANHYERVAFLDAGTVQLTGNVTGSNRTENGTYTYDESNVTLNLRSGFKIGYVSGNILMLYSDPVQMATHPEEGVAYKMN